MTRPADTLHLIRDTRWTPEECGAWQDYVRDVLSRMAINNGLTSWPSFGRPLSLKDQEAVKNLIPVVEYMHTQEVSKVSSLSKEHAAAVAAQEAALKAMTSALAGQAAQTRLMRLGYRSDGVADPEIAHECVDADAAIMRRKGSVQEASIASINAEANEEKIAWMVARAKVRSAVVNEALGELREMMVLMV